MGIEIRDWDRADLPQIQRSWLAFCRNAARSDMRLIPQPEQAMTEWLTSRFKHPAAFGFVAEMDDAMAGFLIGRVDEWESVPPVIEPRKLGIIDALYVDEGFRRQGIGTHLIEHAIGLLRERDVVAVETIYAAWNDASTETWRHAGFAPWMVHAYRLL